jgi:hypothetical protein
MDMSTAYSIYRFAKPTKQEVSTIDYYEPFGLFPIYDADGEQSNENIKLFRCDDENAANIINSKFARRMVLPEKTTDYHKLYRELGFDEKAITEKRVHIKSSDGYNMEYTDGEHIISMKNDEYQNYQIIVQTECVAIKMECLWNSEDEYVYPDKSRVIKFIPELQEYSFVPISNSVLAKAEIPFLIFERYKGKCFIQKY